MKYFTQTLSAAAVACALSAVAPAQAAEFSFSGDIAFHNDVVRISFTLLTDATNVRVWTDSYGASSPYGVNFDPITAVWDMSAGGKLLDTNDDDGTIEPGQNDFDSGLVFDELKAGNYLFTIATYPNWNKGEWLSDGFTYDGAAPIALADWDQPSSHFGMGTHWRVHLTGVDAATAPVPEPGSYALMLAGLAAVALRARRSSAVR
ncbi:DVUA0089 family protein [Aquincola sp. MAHUQ-54]|uniref:DVUA0089 family protein n=1 Tax=Aquincola agrisoli TaxID=3119538 RepID=A0AAW9Q9P5_9BURK